MDIKGIIKKKGYTMTYVAEVTNIHRTSLAKLINAGNPTISTLRKIADAIGCKVGDFFCDEVTQEKSNTIVCPHCGKPISIKIEAI